MVKGLYAYLKEAWKKPSREMLSDRLIEWRASNAVVRVEKPLRIDKARALGYKAKNGIIVVRVRIKRGGRRRRRQGIKGRKSRKTTVRKMLKMNHRWVAEIRASERYQGMEVLNSYWIGKDGQHAYYEVILVDPFAPEIKSDRTLKWLYTGTHIGRTERGLTSAGRKSRGFSSGRGNSPSLKVRPSLRSWNRQGK